MSAHPAGASTFSKTLMPGWYEVSGGRSLHRVIDGGHRKMRTTCGLRVSAVFACRDPRYRRCDTCERIDRRPRTTLDVRAKGT